MVGKWRSKVLQNFWPALSDNWSSFLSGRLRQVLLYNQHAIYISGTWWHNCHRFSPICSNTPSSWQMMANDGQNATIFHQGFFLVSSGAEIRPLSQWDLGDFFPNLKKKIPNLKKKKKKIFFFFFFRIFIQSPHTHSQATWWQSTRIASYFPSI